MIVHRAQSHCRKHHAFDEIHWFAAVQGKPFPVPGPFLNSGVGLSGGAASAERHKVKAIFKTIRDDRRRKDRRTKGQIDESTNRYDSEPTE